MQITGKDLIRWGYKPDKWFAEAILAAEMAQNEQEAQEIVARFVPVPVPQMRLRRENFIVPSICYRSENAEEAANCAAALAHMVEIGKLPTVRASAIMPDTCPVSQVLGTIPVGGIVATENALHPNMHSADICCSMAVSYFDAVDVKTLMDNALALTHFGFGGRARGKQTRPPEYIMEAIQNNDYLRPLASTAIEHFTTQGDGNHFFYLGQSQKDGMAMVTHHGSRGFGAKLYKKGMEVAEKFRRQIAKDVPAHHAWIPFDTIEGQIYWDALQIVRLWTRENHYAIHNMVLDSVGRSAKNRFWNEHNFVFRKEDGLFYHAKGATPAFRVCL
jgi:tRNA-splicing ligase RtcB (3'-phosphate/5'-hydroxy nucleic acid ligase)